MEIKTTFFCREAFGFFDHCYPSGTPSPLVADPLSSVNPGGQGQVSAGGGKTTEYDSDTGTSDLTRLFSSALRSELCDKEKDVAKSCGKCRTIEQYLESQCMNSAYIDSEYLRLYAMHRPRTYVHAYPPDKPVILAHYQPKGIDYSVSPYKGWYYIHVPHTHVLYVCVMRT